MTSAPKTNGAGSPRRFRPYPSYKDSGVEWLGPVPTNWRITPLFTVARERNVRNKTAEEANVLSLSYGRIVRRDVSNNFGLLPQSFDTYQVVEPGNIVLRLTDLQNDKRSLRVGLVNDPGIVTSAYVALEARGPLIAEYAFYLLHAYDLTKVFYTLGAGVRQTMNFKDLKWIPFLSPSEPEQRAIAAFLDRETAKIDALIAKKERLIELLQEKRAAVISQAVTKGLNPRAPMKDSGVEWLGRIPAHWQVRRLRFLGDAIIGLTYDPSDMVGPDERGALVLRASNVADGRIILEDKVFVKCSIPDRLRTQLGDILICSRSGSRALIGKNAKIENGSVGLTFGTFMTVFRSKCNDYLFYVFNSPLFDYQAGTFLTSTINQLTVNNLKDFMVPVPASAERAEIAVFLDRETAKIDAFIAKVRGAIALLQELRIALISAAVTGKIDVRQEVS